MPPVEVKRTLVKSPPELWAELSDPASLARHLGDFGEIRTTRTAPETTVEWEAHSVRGTVELKPSGWGTKVTLSVLRELPEPAATPAAAVIPEATVAPKPEPETQEPDEREPEAVEPEPEAEAVEPEPEPQPAPRPRLFARLFRRWRHERALEPVLEPVEHEVEPTEPTAELRPEPEQQPPDPDPIPDLAAELAAIERTMAEQDTALLTAVLDRLGAAHHRPFSRG
jgi:hypothetical protein